MKLELDLSILREITGGDIELEKELFASFFECADACLTDLAQAVNSTPQS